MNAQNLQNPGYTIGIDIESIARFEQRPYATHAALYHRLFTDAEIAYCRSQRRPAQHFTARFCAKEAAVKALRPYGKYFYRDFEIRRAEDGAPSIHVAEHRGDRTIPLSLQVSLSHCDDYAVAMVLAVGGGRIDG